VTVPTAASAYASEEWSELFVASGGASAALAGLVFVAVSINVERILRYPGLPARALETVLLLVGVVVVSLLALGPDLEGTELGVILLAEGLVVSTAIGLLIVRNRPPPGGPTHMPGRIGIAAAGTLPFVIGAVSVLAGSGGGLWWTLAGMIGAIIGAVINAWVLLVEILR
jgi:hypothetical protein